MGSYECFLKGIYPKGVPLKQHTHMRLVHSFRGSPILDIGLGRLREKHRYRFLGVPPPIFRHSHATPTKAFGCCWHLDPGPQTRCSGQKKYTS